MEIRRTQRKAITIIVILFVLAVLVAAGCIGYFWYQKTRSDQSSQTSKGGSISLDSTQKVETEQLTTALVIPKSTDKPGDSIKVSSLGITVPKSWRTVNAKSVINTPLANVYADSYNDILAQLVMVPEKNPTDPLQTTNSFSLYNITTWLTKPTPGNSGTATPAAKAAYIQNITDVAAGKKPSKDVCAKGYGVLNASICADLLEPTPITTSDGSLAGVAYLGTTAQGVSYDPQAIVMLTGKAKDQQLFAYGVFHLLDSNSHSLSINDTEAIKAAWEDFKKGNIPSDTMQLYQHVIDAIKSIAIQVN